MMTKKEPIGKRGKNSRRGHDTSQPSGRLLSILCLSKDATGHL